MRKIPLHTDAQHYKEFVVWAEGYAAEEAKLGHGLTRQDFCTPNDAGSRIQRAPDAVADEI